MDTDTGLIVSLPDGQTVDVHLSHKARTRISLSITPKGIVRLSVPPKCSRRDALTFLQAQREWLTQQLQKRQNDLITVDEPLSAINYLGKRLSLEPLSGRRATAHLVEDVLLVYGARDEAQRRQIVANWLRRQAATVILPQVNRLAEQYGVKPAAIALSSAGRRWGSCTAQGNIRINWRLIQAPDSVIDYVITHELAHLLHMNHSAAFWAQVESWCQDWQSYRRWLRHNGMGLFLVG